MADPQETQPPPGKTTETDEKKPPAKSWPIVWVLIAILAYMAVHMAFLAFG